MAIERQDIPAHVDVYLERLGRLITQYRAGEISEAEAIRLHSGHSTDLSVAMTDNFVALLFEDRQAAAAAAAAPVKPMEEYPSVVRTGAHRASTHQDPQVSSLGDPTAAPAALAPPAGDE